MPTFDYRCNDCGTIYDVFHKVREITEDVVCPSCNSTNHVRLLSAPHVSMASSTKAGGSGDAPPNFGGCCGGGACGIN